MVRVSSEPAVGSHLFLVVEALVVVLKGGIALPRPGRVVGVRIDDVAGENLLPEREAAAGTCGIGDAEKC